MMNVLDLFSGIGGFSLGLERTGGFRTVAFCEINPYCRRVLAKHWPDVPIFDDVHLVSRRSVDIVTLGSNVDVICGGFPCQDISFAGKGAGLAGSRSGLWKEYTRIVGELRPTYVIVENVAALLSRGFGDVLGDLATLGYHAIWHCIPAFAVGLPHARDRLWIVAYADSQRELQPGWFFQDFGRRVLHPFQGAVWPLPDDQRDRDDYGVPEAVDALGNAVVPQIPEIIGRAILAAEVQP